MPVYINYQIDTISHFNFTDKSEINAFFLTDKIYFGFGSLTIYSLGDIFIYFGGYGFFLIMVLNIIFTAKFIIKLIREKNETHL